MKNSYDVLIIGGGTAGTYFAHGMAAQGYSVCVADAASEEDLGARLKVFHTDTERFASYGVPEPKTGDEDFLGLFLCGEYLSPLSDPRHTKRAEYPFTVSKLPPFLRRLRAWCEGAGAEFYCNTAFLDFIFDQTGKICGATLLQNGGQIAVKARLVADCSGIKAVARTKLPAPSKVPTFAVSPRDMFYVILKYVRLENPQRDAVKIPKHWAYYKGWFSAGDRPDTAIIGVGANLSFEFAEKCMEKFEKSCILPPHAVERVDRGLIPYRYAPYSLVMDGFICLGDAACMNKPYTGEGITAGWVGCKLAAEVAGKAMRDGAYPTEARLWELNVKYNRGQAADFAYINSTVVNAVDCKANEMEYEFKHDMVFSTTALTRLNRRFNADIPLNEAFALVFKMLWGLFSGNISFATVKNLLRGISYAGKLKSHYKKFPKTPDGARFAKWTKKADALWEATGTVADATERIDGWS